MMETKDIIDVLSDSDNLGVKNSFKDTINTKVADTLGNKKKRSNKYIC